MSDDAAIDAINMARQLSRQVEPWTWREADIARLVLDRLANELAEARKREAAAVAAEREACAKAAEAWDPDYSGSRRQFAADGLAIAAAIRARP